ncbi:MAG: sodium-dependent bicarbonate transport family permease [Anaeromyxobacteraceae bacterium]
MGGTELLRANLLSPLVLAFALGAVARAVRSELRIPKELYQALSIYLLLALGLKGGVELAHAGLSGIWRPALATLLLGCITPLTAYLALRRLGRFSTDDAAGIAAHYGSVSAVTFLAAQQFVTAVGAPAEPYMATLLALLESPGIHIALAIGVVARLRRAQEGQAAAEQEAAVPLRAAVGGPGGFVTAVGPMGNPAPVHDRPATLGSTLHEVLTGRTMVLLAGGLVVGFLMGERGWTQVQPFFESGFKGALVVFLLEMGMVAASRAGDLRRVGPFLLVFGMVTPLVHGALGVWLAHLAGLSPGGATVLGAMAASASYIAAPPAVRAQLPEANPTYSLTLALAITFPFNVLVGIPFFYWLAS